MRWEIMGYDSLEPMFDKPFTVECQSDDQVIELLKCLASRHLEPYEILSCFLPVDSGRRRSHLDISPANGLKGRGYMTKDNPYYTANIADQQRPTP